MPLKTRRIQPTPMPSFMPQKEAALKALGTGLASGMRWEHISVKHLPTGQPYIKLSGEALRLASEKTPPGYEPDVHLSLSDDGDYAQAFVVISVSLKEKC